MQQTLAEERLYHGRASFLAEVNQLRDSGAVSELKRILVSDGYAGDEATACHSINELLDTMIQTFDGVVLPVEDMVKARCGQPPVLGHMPEEADVRRPPEKGNGQTS